MNNSLFGKIISKFLILGIIGTFITAIIFTTLLLNVIKNVHNEGSNPWTTDAGGLSENEKKYQTYYLYSIFFYIIFICLLFSYLIFKL